MRILVIIAVLCFLTLAWATLAIARHIRRTTTPLPAAPSAPLALVPALSPDHTRTHRYATQDRHDRTYASPDSGNLKDPGARAHTRPRRTKSKP